MTYTRRTTRLALIASAALALTALVNLPAEAATHTALARDYTEPGFTTVHIVGQVQQGSTWCGVAATATTITNWRRTPPSQASIAAAEGTGGNGTGPANIANYLNRYFGASVYAEHAHVTNDMLWRAVTTNQSFPRDDVFTILVRSNAIWYKSAPNYYMHYLVIFGFNPRWSGNGGKPAYLVWDPEPVSTGGGVHHLSASDWTIAAVPGDFVIGPN